MTTTTTPGPEKWLSTTELADIFGVTVTTVGNWFRNQTIPPEHAQRVTVERRNGLTGSEWRARASYIHSEFAPPDPKGGPHRRRTAAEHHR